MRFYQFQLHRIEVVFQFDFINNFCVPGLELATPVLEQPNPFTQVKPHPHLLTMSMSWLLAGALPHIYSQPQKALSPNNSGVGK